MKNKYLLTFDAGTGAGRCNIVDKGGKLIASAYADWSYFNPEDAPLHGKAFDPHEFWGVLSCLCKKAIQDAGISAKDIKGVSVTSQREGMVFLDARGKEIYSGPNVDTRAVEEVNQLLPCTSEIRQITGLIPVDYYGAARLLWFQQRCPEVYERIDKVLMMSDWIIYRLTGKTSSEPSIASSSLLFDIRSRNWSERMMEIVGVQEDIFPEIYSAGEQIGVVTPNAAEDSGLISGTPVISGGGDTQMGLLGMGLSKPNQIGVVAGTSTPLMMILDEAFIDPEQLMYTNCYALDDRWTLESLAGMTGLPYRWVRDTFANLEVTQAEKIGKDSFAYLDDLVSEISPGAGGVMAFIGAERTDLSRTHHSSLGGFVFPITWILDQYDRRHFFRAALEAMAYGIRANADQLASICDSRVDKLYVCGGQTRSKIFTQLLANTINLPIHTFEVEDASSLGAAICAAVGIGVFNNFQEAIQAMVHGRDIIEPQSDMVPKYQETYQRWLSVGEYLINYAGDQP